MQATCVDEPTPSILLVEQDETSLASLARILRNEGFEVLTCRNISELPSSLERNDLGAVVVGFNIPEMREGRLPDRLRALSGTTPIILHDGRGDGSSARRAGNPEGCVCVEKSNDPDGLRRAVHRALRQGLLGRLSALQAEYAEQSRLLRESEERFRRLNDCVHVQATLGDMAVGLAHELNQPLSAVNNYIRGCLRRLDASGAGTAEVTQALQRAAAQAQRAGEIVRRVRDFARKDPSRRVEVDLNESIRDALTFVELELQENGIHLSLELEQKLPRPRADRMQVEQVLVNLLRNACDALRETPPERREIQIRSAPVEDAGVEIQIRDRGAGLAPGAAQRLFEPLFTTKTDGTGIGLSISRSIVRAHGGQLSLDADPEGGTVARLVITASNEVDHDAE